MTVGSGGAMDKMNVGMVYGETRNREDTTQGKDFHKRQSSNAGLAIGKEIKRVANIQQEKNRWIDG